MDLLKRILPVLAASLILNACTPDGPPPAKEKDLPAKKTTPQIHYSVKARYPHDVSLFTEGLLFHDNVLYESSGAPSHLPQTKSAVGISDLKTGKFTLKAELDRNIYFGEGILIMDGKLYQLTWQNQLGFIYDLRTFNRIGQFSYQNKEGWGLTTEGKHMIMSDGSYNLTYLDPKDFSVVKTVPVLKDGYGLDNINELEFINGFIYANVWMTNLIVKIDPETGVVVGQLDLSALQSEAFKSNKQIGEMNGIAYDSLNDRILVTGKMWADIFEIDFPH